MVDKKLILIIEDEVDLSKMLKLRIEAMNPGYEVDLAFDGEEGMKALCARKIDLLILDINLPKKNGIEIYKEIADNKENKPPFPVLVFTARKELETFFEQMDVDGFVSKPFDAGDLLKEVERLLCGRDKPTIFIIDEESKSVASGTRDVLKKKGYSVLIMNDYNTFKKMAVSHMPDFIIMEYERKNEGGDGFIDEVKNFIIKMQKLNKKSDSSTVLASKVWPSTHRTRIIVYADSGADKRQEAEKLGVDWYIGKLENPLEILNVIKSVLKKEEKERQEKSVKDQMKGQYTERNKPGIDDFNFFKF